MTRNDMSLLFHPKHQPISEPIFAAHEPFDPELWSVPLRELRHGDWVNGKPLEEWCDQKETRCTVAREYYAYKSCVMRYNGQLLEYFDRRSVSDYDHLEHLCRLGADRFSEPADTASCPRRGRLFWRGGETALALAGNQAQRLVRHAKEWCAAERCVGSCRGEPTRIMLTRTSLLNRGLRDEQ